MIFSISVVAHPASLVARLAGLGLALIALAASGGCQLMDNMRGDTPRRAVLRMENQESADQRRQGVIYLMARDFGRRPPYTERYEQIARTDSHPHVRAIALRALNRSREPGATDVFIESLADPSDRVRLEAAKGLANIPADGAAPALIRLVRNREENQDVRIAAADALRHYRRTDVAQALIDQLDQRAFGIAWQSRRSLRKLTGQDFRYDVAAWLQYIAANPFS
jgi:hypothetical protein